MKIRGRGNCSERVILKDLGGTSAPIVISQRTTEVNKKGIRHAYHC
jgi:hypothetical protein